MGAGAAGGSGRSERPGRSEDEVAGPSGRRSTDSDGPSSALLRSSSSRAQRHMKFVDKDEHVYFWFPLLAGLSELTFDPR